MTTQVTVWQILIGFAYAPIQTLQDWGDLPLDEIPPQFGQGGSTLFTTWSILWEWLMFILMVFLYNIFALKVLQIGSASLMYVAISIQLPIVSVCSASAFIMGEGNSTPLNNYIIGAFLIMMVGLFVYAYQEEILTQQAAANTKGGGGGDEKLGSFSLEFSGAISTLALRNHVLREEQLVVKPRSQERMREDLMHRLGFSVTNSPRLNARRAESKQPLLVGPDDDSSVN